ncbi:segregation/condensation protein A [Halorussus vallis]|nr:ScpA family protein [Halorussus vallis]USZ77726.1 segregation/condensation protein A [Halorussus vallis]
MAGHEEEKRKREREGEESDLPGGNAPESPAVGGDSGADGSDDGGSTSEDGDAILDEVAADVPDSDDDEGEPVELLVQLAEEGEIEPWDIDIVTVTDKFLDRLDGSDLRTSGRALFYASVLLRMKSDALLADDEEEEEPEDPWAEWGPDAEMPMEGEDGDFPAYDPVNQLEAEMERRLDRKSARGSPETLDELVRELRERERGSWWKESRSYDTSKSPHGFSRGTQTLDYHTGDDMRMDDEPSEDEALGTAHDEHIEVVIDDVQVELERQYDAGREEVLYAEIDTVGGTRIETFLALLFLSHRGVVTLEQDDLFGDLWVIDAATADAETDDSDEAEAIAD